MRSSKDRLKRSDKVHVQINFVGKVMNPIYDRGNLVGYRVTDMRRPSWWYVVKAEDVSKVE